MTEIKYIDRLSGKRETEKVYGSTALQMLYGDSLMSKLCSPLLYFVSKNPIFSALFGWWQRRSFTKKNIVPFIKNFHVDTSEFLEPVECFQSFNDFFIRKLKPESRPITSSENSVVIPADGRYLFFPNIDEAEGFVVKGEKFHLSTLLQCEKLAHKYAKGTMIIARLCPSDYHRFHFVCECTPGETRWINGWWHSVNPIAIRKNIHIFSNNKRTICELNTEIFGKVIFMEIGATNVGSVTQTYTPHYPHSKGAEKGFFSFGASSLIIFFEPNTIILDDDLIAASKQYTEIRCFMGQSMGKRK